ncbi:MAG: hypothetical protein IPJ55_09165 [Chloracidobacterium sp.]|nr:hypothetical protein [Chloracidobacterium sp.]
MARKSPRKKKVDARQVAYTRFMFIVIVFAFWMLGISARLVNLQVTQHEWLRDKAVVQRQDVKKSKLLRGTIYDRDERPLAMSIRVKSLYADPTEITDIDATAKILAKSLKLDAGQIAKQLNDGKAAKKRFVPILKKLDEETVQRINKTLVADKIQKADMPRFDSLRSVGLAGYRFF